MLLLIDEAIELIKIEVHIVNLRIKYPEQFQQHANKLFLSPLHLADKTSLINVIEIVSGLYLSKRVIYQNGKPVHLIDLGKAFEWLFNIKLGDYHQKYMDVIKRNPAKLTEFLNELTILFLADYKKEGAFFIAYLLFLFWAVAFLYFW